MGRAAMSGPSRSASAGRRQAPVNEDMSLQHDALDRVEHIMGMPIGIDVRDTDVDPISLDRAFDWFRWVDATFSTYKPDSQISRLNRGELQEEDLHDDVRAVLQQCEELRIQTAGYFDAQVRLLSNAVDPSGFVKGW